MRYKIEEAVCGEVGFYPMFQTSFWNFGGWFYFRNQNGCGWVMFPKIEEARSFIADIKARRLENKKREKACRPKYHRA